MAECRRIKSERRIIINGTESSIGTKERGKSGNRSGVHTNTGQSRVCFNVFIETTEDVRFDDIGRLLIWFGDLDFGLGRGSGITVVLIEDAILDKARRPGRHYAEPAPVLD